MYTLAEPTVGTQNSKVLCGAGHLLTLDLDVARKLLNVLSCPDSKRSALGPGSETLSPEGLKRVKIPGSPFPQGK